MQGYQGDWREDSHLENGNYWCKCVTCEADFIGHKYRVVCKRCATQKVGLMRGTLNRVLWIAAIIVWGLYFIHSLRTF